MLFRSVQNGQLGSPHSLEIPFVFNHVRLMENVAGKGAEQDRLAGQMSEIIGMLLIGSVIAYTLAMWTFH